jgi:acyl-CoA synthetase (AMP-forming)/AMP-acid ligase II
VTTTLQGLLLNRCDSQPWLICPSNPLRSDEAVVFGRSELLRRSLACASALRANGARGAPVVMVCDNDWTFAVGFFGILLAGMIPVPLPTPHFAESRQACLHRLGLVLRDCTPACIVVGRAIGESMPFEDGGVPVLVVEDTLNHALSPGVPCVSSPSDTALIQYTSGSTQAPRGAELSHEGILRNVAAIGEAVAADAEDVGVSWLPLFHDMGLIGSFLFTLAWGMRYVLLKPQAFLFRPATWLWAISRFGGTLSPAPNFAYQHCVSRIPDALVSGLDLRSWRIAFNGAEMVHPETIAAFARRFAAAGFEGQLLPVYGLAENSLAVAFATAGSPLRVEHLDRQPLASTGRAVIAQDSEGARAVVGVGRALDGQTLRVTDGHGKVLPERHVGEIEVQGPCVMKGYYGQPRETSRAFSEDGWLRTGDRGYLADSELFVLGRGKDVVKRNGASLDPVDIQHAAGSLAGIRGGGVAAFGVEDAAQGTARLIVAVETTLTDEKALHSLRQDVVLAVLRRCRVRPDDVLLLKGGGLPRSTSGKIRNGECRRRYLARALAVLNV